MIQAIDLKVNNLVKRNDISGLYSVRALCKDRVHDIELEEIFKDGYGNQCGYACQCTLSELEGIELTGEFLLSAGFTTDENKIEYRIGLPIGEGIDLFIEDEGGGPYMCGLDKTGTSFDTYLRPINSVHDLQNLYLALTGEELTLTLPSTPKQ